MIGEIFSSLFGDIFETKEERHAKEIEKMKKVLEKESLICNKCNSIAYPVWGTKNKYKCTNCSNRFTNSKHNVIGLALEEFDIGPMQYSKTREEKLQKIYEEITR